MKKMKKIVREDGIMTIVEATIVFPIMFIVLFFLMYVANMFYLNARIQGLVDNYAISAARVCSNPWTAEIDDKVPIKIDDIKPYRYYIGGMNDIEKKVEDQLKEKVLETGAFVDMTPESVSCEAKYNNHIIYYTFSVEASYSIQYPIRLFGQKEFIKNYYSARAEAPISDDSEFIRNTDMAIDYMESSKTVQAGLDKVREAMTKVKEFVGKFSKN